MWSYYEPCEWIKQSGLMMTRPYISLCIVSDAKQRKSWRLLVRSQEKKCWNVLDVHREKSLFELALYVNLGYTWPFFIKKNAFNDKIVWPKRSAGSQTFFFLRLIMASKQKKLIVISNEMSSFVLYSPQCASCISLIKLLYRNQIQSPNLYNLELRRE